MSVHWELMFTRSLFETADMDRQGKLLGEVAGLVDAGKLQTTVTEMLRPINAANLKAAHALIESGKARARSCSRGSESGAAPRRPQKVAELLRPRTNTSSLSLSPPGW